MLTGVWVVICLLYVGVVTANATSYANTTMIMTDNAADDSNNNNDSGDLLGSFLKKKKRKKSTVVVRIPLRHAKGSSQWGFVGAIGVGKGTYEVMFDTLSSNTWLFDHTIEENYGTLFIDDDNNLTQKQKKNKQQKQRKNQFYDCKKSKTAKHCNVDSETDEWLVLEYSDGSTYGGGVVEEHLKIGKITLEDFNMGWVSDMDEYYAKRRGGDFKGMVGLGGEGFAEQGGDEVLRELFYREHLSSPIFSFYVSQDMESGEIMFGDHNKDLIAQGEEIAYFKALKLAVDPIGEPDLPLDTDGGGGENNEETWEEWWAKDSSDSEKTPARDDDTFSLPWWEENDFTTDVVWALKFNELSVGGKQMLSVLYTKGFHAALGTTLPHGIVVPKKGDLKEIVKLIGNGATLSVSPDDEAKLEVVINCDVRENLPDLTLTIRKTHLRFSGMEYFPSEIPGEEEKGMCASFFGVRSESEYDRFGDPDMWQLGVHFMRKYYTVYNEKDAHYDYGPSIGIALSDGKAIPYGDDEKKTGKPKKKLKKNKKQMGLWGKIRRRGGQRGQVETQSEE